MTNELFLRIFDVEHGACAILSSPKHDRLAMIDCGHNTTTGWRPSTYIRYVLGVPRLDYLFITNADQDHVSDLDGLWLHNVEVGVLHRNWTPDVPILRLIKEENGKLTSDMERYLKIHREYTAPVPVPFNIGMGGVTCSTFHNVFPDFIDTNNLSLVTFIKYGGFKILFPGDLEYEGWKKLLKNPSFLHELIGTDILVASHHGRNNGFCEDIFNYFIPRAVVISDKPVKYKTQETIPDYRQVVNPNGVIVANQTKNRHVLTTRRDGDILFSVAPNGDFRIFTAKNGSSWQVA